MLRGVAWISVLSVALAVVSLGFVLLSQLEESFLHVAAGGVVALLAVAMSILALRE